jgi:opacity protein-like surface antigen
MGKRMLRRINSMRKLLALLVLVLAVSFTAAAQDTPQAEVFGGYSYLRVNPGEEDGDEIPGLNAHGGSGSVAFNATPMFGVVADLGVYRISNIEDSGINANVVSYLFGPKISVRGERVDPFVQLLFGGARISVESESENAFAMALGGGVDVKATDNIAIRVIQAEYVLTRFSVEDGVRASQHNARISAGVVFRIGMR